MTHAPIRKRGPAVDFGYRQDADDPQLLLPIPEQLDCLADGMKLVKQGCTFREVANWISARTGRYLSHKNLWKKFHEDRRTAERERKRAYRAKYYKRRLKDMGYQVIDTQERAGAEAAQTPPSD